MKLYTKEQIINAIKIAARKAGYNSITDTSCKSIIDTLNPIELPNDEEIEKKSLGFSDWPKEKASFSYGAKWMRDKIQGGVK